MAPSEPFCTEITVQFNTVHQIPYQMLVFAFITMITWHIALHTHKITLLHFPHTLLHSTTTTHTPTPFPSNTAAWHTALHMHETTLHTTPHCYTAILHTCIHFPHAAPLNHNHSHPNSISVQHDSIAHGTAYARNHTAHHTTLLHFPHVVTHTTMTIHTLASFLGLARTIYIRCIYNIFGREITKYTVIYGVYIRFWPTLASFPMLSPRTETNTSMVLRSPQ
jgi:hypothetical protein